MMLSLRKTHLIIIGSSVLALSGAYISEFGFNLKPCHLCMLQRYPYMAAIGLSAVGLWCIRNARIAWGSAIFSTASLAIGSAIAWYHSGVERSIFEGPSGCTTGGSTGNIDDLKNSILNAPIVACNQPAFEWMGVSMANMNAAYSTLLVLFAVYALHHARSADRACHQPAPCRGHADDIKEPASGETRRSMENSGEFPGSIK